MTQRTEPGSLRWDPKHFYFEKYEVLDGESQYPLLAVRATIEPLTFEEWIREFVAFACATNGWEPWSEQQIEEFLRDVDPRLEVYGGMRIYRRFLLEEISRAEYDVLDHYLMW